MKSSYKESDLIEYLTNRIIEENKVNESTEKRKQTIDEGISPESIRNVIKNIYNKNVARTLSLTEKAGQNSLYKLQESKFSVNQDNAKNSTIAIACFVTNCLLCKIADFLGGSVIASVKNKTMKFSEDFIKYKTYIFKIFNATKKGIKSIIRTLKATLTDGLSILIDLFMLSIGGFLLFKIIEISNQFASLFDSIRKFLNSIFFGLWEIFKLVVECITGLSLTGIDDSINIGLHQKGIKTSDPDKYHNGIPAARTSSTYVYTKPQIQRIIK